MAGGLLVAGEVGGGPQRLPAGLPLLFQGREPLHQERCALQQYRPPLGRRSGQQLETCPRQIGLVLVLGYFEPNRPGPVLSLTVGIRTEEARGTALGLRRPGRGSGAARPAGPGGEQSRLS